MNVLLSLDHSRQAQITVEFLRRLGLPAGSHLKLLHAIEPAEWPEGATQRSSRRSQEQLHTIQDTITAKAHQFLKQQMTQFRDSKVNIRPLVTTGIAGAEILSAIEKDRIDLAVIGTRGLSGRQRFLLGSVSEWVLSDAPCSVLLVRNRSPRSSSKRSRGMCVLFATDASAESMAAVRLLKRLRLPRSSMIVVLHVVEKQTYYTSHLLGKHPTDLTQLGHEIDQLRRRAGGKLLGEARQKIKQPGLTVRGILAYGHAPQEILKTAKQVDADLVMVGSRGLTGLRRLLPGSVSLKVARHAPCSVLVVRKGT